jgi:glucose/arabinose dehydrogenase
MVYPGRQALPLQNVASGISTILPSLSKVLGIVMMATCWSGGHASAATLEPAAVPPGASKTVTLKVAAAMEAPPFDVPRTLMVPPGFDIRVFARVPNPRFMALAPNGDVLVSEPSAGTVHLLRPDGDAAPRQFTFASGLKNPHDIAFHSIGNRQYVYLSESNRIIRAPYASGDTRIGTIQPVVEQLPDAASAGSGGYGHPLKNFALHGNKLYVSIASTCNACIADTTSDPIRGAIYEYSENGGQRRLYARGIRNAEGLAFRPGTDELWAVVNHRDNIRYPFHKDYDGNGSDDYGRVMQSYVDGHPPDLLLRVKDGAHYGWPFCNPNPDQGLDNMPYDADLQFNADGKRLDCSRIERATKGIAAHSAPLGMSFLQDSGLPASYRNALVTGLHGCWNCSALNGHKIVLYPIAANGSVGDAVDMVSGWVTDTANKERWGRPVDAIPDGKQGLYISDDMSGTIYQLTSR